MGPRQTAIALDARADVATLVLRSGKSITAGVIRLVQLPTDTERSLDTSFEPGATPWQRQQGSTAVEATTYVGVLVAFLHRHTEQGDIAIDFFPARDARAIALDVPVSGEVPVEQTIREVTQQLAQALPASAGWRSNIAVTFVDVPPGGIEGIDAATAIGPGCGDYDA